MLLGIITEAFDSQRLGVAVVLIMFGLGYIFLQSVNEKEGIKVAQNS